MTIQENGEDKEKKKGRRKGKGCWIAMLILLVIIAVERRDRLVFLSKEHREAASLPLNAVDFSKLNDGTYHGAYAGGMYKWRVNECDVTVTNGKVTEIQLTASH